MLKSIKQWRKFALMGTHTSWNNFFFLAKCYLNISSTVSFIDVFLLLYVLSSLMLSKFTPLLSLKASFVFASATFSLVLSALNVRFLFWAWFSAVFLWSLVLLACWVTTRPSESISLPCPASHLRNCSPGQRNGLLAGFPALAFAF